MEVGGREVSRPQRLAERGIPRVAREAAAENLEGTLDPAAQLTKRAGAFPLGFTGPLLQPAGLRPVVSAWCKSGGVGDEPDENEVGIDLACEHRLEVELEIRLARQRLAVPQDAEPESVRDDRPQVRVASVEELLHQPVRVGGGRTPAAPPRGDRARGRGRRDAPPPVRKSARWHRRGRRSLGRRRRAGSRIRTREGAAGSTGRW